MKLSKETIEILANFAKINNSLLIQEGNQFFTRDANKTIFGVATVPEQFENEIGIYDLQSLLQYMKLCGGNPDFTVESDYIVMDGNGTRIRYKLADKDIIICQETAPIIKGDVFSTVKFDSSVLDTILKARMVGVTKADTVEFYGNGGDIVVRILNEENSASSVVSKSVEGDMIECEEFSIKFKAEQFPMIDGDYELNIYKREISAGNFVFFAQYVGDTVTYVCPAKANAGAYVN